MNRSAAIKEELAQMNPVMVQWPFHMPYRVPRGYFENLTEIILEQSLAGLSVHKTRVYDVPDHYFQELPASIMANIRRNEVEEELEEVAPLLHTVSRKMPYSGIAIPSFNMEAVMERAAVNEVPVIQMPVRKSRRWLQYASAAVVTGVIVAAAFIYNGNTTDATTVEQYAQIDVSQEISKLSEEELNTYLAATEKLVINTGDRDVYGIEALPEVDEHIEMTSDDELKQYLEESAESITETKADTNS